MKCDDCLQSRAAISENGWHSTCSLSPKEAAECILGKKNHKIRLEPFDFYGLYAEEGKRNEHTNANI